MTNPKRKIKFELMWQKWETILISSVFVFSGFSAFVGIRKRPRSGMKVSFFAMVMLFFLGNGMLLIDTFFFPDLLANQAVVPHLFSLVLASSIVVFGLYFPTFFRNLTYLTVAASAAMGGAFMTAAFLVVFKPDLSIPIQSKLNVFLEVFQFLIFALFCYLVTFKLEYSFPALDVFIKTCYAGVILSFVFWFSIFLYGNDSIFSKNSLRIVYFYDLLLFYCFFAFLAHFTFSDYYLDHPLSYLVEFPKMVLSTWSMANVEGTRFLKKSLWDLYETQNWKELMDSFWYQIMVDETLDNALEHGGKRGNDQITVHVFESQKFIDVYVSDQGKGFDPKTIPNPLLPERKVVPSGRGIHILKKLFQVRWNFLGNEVMIRIDKELIKNRELPSSQ